MRIRSPASLQGAPGLARQIAVFTRGYQPNSRTNPPMDSLASPNSMRVLSL